MQPLSPQQKEQLRQDGFLILESAFSPEKMRKLEAALDQHALNADRDVVFAQKVAERDDQIKAFACGPAFVQLSTALLGPDTDLYFNQIVYKNPEGAKPFSWHQDDAYGPVEPSPYLTIWIAINDATEENGCLSVLPGSHHAGLRTHTNSNFGLSGYSHDEADQGLLVPLTAGSMVCLWSLTLHKSGANRSTGVRKGLVLQYCPVGMRHKATGMNIRPKIQVARNGRAVFTAP